MPVRSTYTKVPVPPESAAGQDSFLSWVLHAEGDLGPVILRLVLAGVMFPHGAQHLLGWFGGYGFSGTSAWMTGLGFPASLAALAIVLEFVAPLALAAGFASRPAALAIIGVMLGALTVHVQNGFFMNWFGSLAAGAEGYEYHLLVIAMALTVAFTGGGRWSVDRALSHRLSRAQARTVGNSVWIG